MRAGSADMGWTECDAITRCRDQLGGSPSVPCPLGMDLTAWFGSQGVFSTGEAAHIFGSGPVNQPCGVQPRLASSVIRTLALAKCR
jgi:hypothetical protein